MKDEAIGHHNTYAQVVTFCIADTCVYYMTFTPDATKHRQLSLYLYVPYYWLVMNTREFVV